MLHEPDLEQRRRPELRTEPGIPAAQQIEAAGGIRIVRRQTAEKRRQPAGGNVGEIGLKRLGVSDRMTGILLQSLDHTRITRASPPITTSAVAEERNTVGEGKRKKR